MFMYSFVTSCVLWSLMKLALVNHVILVIHVSVFTRHSFSLSLVSSDKCSQQTWIYPPSLPPRFVRPLPSSHPRNPRIRCPSLSCPPVSSFPSPFNMLLAMSPPSFLSINFSLPVSCFVIPRSFSNRALLNFLFESLWLWRPPYARGRNCTRYWVTQSQMTRKQHVLLSLRTSFPSIRCSTQNHITSAFH